MPLLVPREPEPEVFVRYFLGSNAALLLLRGERAVDERLAESSAKPSASGFASMNPEKPPREAWVSVMLSKRSCLAGAWLR